MKWLWSVSFLLTLVLGCNSTPKDPSHWFLHDLKLTSPLKLEPHTSVWWEEGTNFAVIDATGTLLAVNNDNIEVGVWVYPHEPQTPISVHAHHRSTIDGCYKSPKPGHSYSFESNAETLKALTTMIQHCLDNKLSRSEQTKLLSKSQYRRAKDWSLEETALNALRIAHLEYWMVKDSTLSKGERDTLLALVGCGAYSAQPRIITGDLGSEGQSGKMLKAYTDYRSEKAKLLPQHLRFPRCVDAFYVPDDLAAVVKGHTDNRAEGGKVLTVETVFGLPLKNEEERRKELDAEPQLSIPISVDCTDEPVSQLLRTIERKVPFNIGWNGKRDPKLSITATEMPAYWALWWIAMRARSLMTIQKGKVTLTPVYDGKVRLKELMDNIEMNCRTATTKKHFPVLATPVMIDCEEGRIESVVKALQEQLPEPVNIRIQGTHRETINFKAENFPASDALEWCAAYSGLKPIVEKGKITLVDRDD